MIVGDLGLSSFEDDLSSQWSDCLDGKERAFRVISTFYRLLLQAAYQHEAELVFIDVGPNLGAINRAALIAAEYVIVPLAPDLYSLQGLRNLGPTLRRWRKEWKARLDKNPEAELPLPTGAMHPAGYVILQHAMRLDRPVKAYDNWMKKIPDEYNSWVLQKTANRKSLLIEDDPNCLAKLKHYHSLMPLSMEAGKPMFLLRPADGAIGAHQQAVQGCFRDFLQLAININNSCNLQLLGATNAFSPVSTESAF